MPQDRVVTFTHLYTDYPAWKGWNELFIYSSEHAGYFQGEFRDLKIADADVLEIGFGTGNCLAWMKEQGARLSGTEINETARQAASERGVAILPANLPEVASDHESCFDTIIALDVFEHLELEEVRKYLEACEIMLRPGGRLLLRFPNAQSPFGLAPQMADPTHRSELSKSVVEFLIFGQNLAIVRYTGSFLYQGEFFSLQWAARILRGVVQSIISRGLNFIYSTKIPYTPVVTIVLVKA